MREELIARVVLHSGLSTEEAQAAIVTVLAALRAELGRPEAEALADELPHELAAALRHGRHEGGGSLARRVAAVERVPLGDAVEHAACVCRALAALVPREVLERVRAAASTETAALLVAPEPNVLEAHPHAARHTLAEGRPGSRRPLSEARPRSAQAHSVAATDNPHADTKLSSSRGLTQEREAESLATGRPGPSRPLSEAGESGHERGTR